MSCWAAISRNEDGENQPGGGRNKPPLAAAADCHCAVQAHAGRETKRTQEGERKRGIHWLPTCRVRARLDGKFFCF